MRPFTTTELTEYRAYKRAGRTNVQIGKRWRRTAAEVDLALWAMLGRTPFQAANHLNKREAA